MTAAAYTDVIETVLLPYVLDGPFPDGLYHFQQDGASVHTATKVRELDSLGVMTLDWPAGSPDLNIIENVWGLLKKNLAKQPGLTRCSSNDLWGAVEKEWVRLRNDPTLVTTFTSLSLREQSCSCLVELQRDISLPYCNLLRHQ
ncbi:hypothetical protein HPB49_024581 [Dermacentor silvarum]|uniref:Uncharacterized protein n=1 Tax=Dermacentor silvarum TaxID=543639 RepID=A0ACB8C652_DERSI|nr:hypothetical protein HPB49_024581 [Dermacentor silvarum]